MTCAVGQCSVEASGLHAGLAPFIHATDVRQITPGTVLGAGTTEGDMPSCPGRACILVEGRSNPRQEVTGP